MADRAQVSSIEAINTFLSRLIVFLEKARPVAEEAGSELRRIQLWIDTDQRLHWEREYRRRAHAHEEARQALLSARISSFRGAIASEQIAVHKAGAAVAEAEEKLRVLKRWGRDFVPLTHPLVRPVETLNGLLSQDMAKAVVVLTELLRHLEAYAEARHGPPPS